MLSLLLLVAVALLEGRVLSSSSSFTVEETLSSSPSDAAVPLLSLTRLRLLAPPFHQFLMALSLLPFKWRAISAQRFPYLSTNSSINRPSSGVIGVLFKEGFKFWWYLSRACLADRVSNIWDILTQLRFFSPPNRDTKSSRCLSSSGDQGPRRNLEDCC